MKKLLSVLGLITLMAGAIVSGTLAMYTTSIDRLAEGSVTAKEFIFTSEGTDSFQQGVKIAPSETVRWQFKVKNFDRTLITETDLYYKLTFRVAATPGKSAIQPLSVSVRDASGAVLKSVTGVGTFDITGAFPLSQLGQEKAYAVEIRWPSDGASDIAYAGGAFGSTVTIDAAASQLPFGGETPQQGAVSVRYETTAAWTNGQSGNYEFNYRVTVTNNSPEPIKGWRVVFSLPTDRIRSAFSNAILTSSTPEGTYTFDNPNYNNVNTDWIQPGQSVTFSGNARGRGTEAVTNVSVGGSNMAATTNVLLSCEFGKSF